MNEELEPENEPTVADEVSRDNSGLVSLFVGAALASATTFALCILVFQVSEIPLIWAYLILGIIILTSVLFIVFWARRQKVSRKLLGVSIKDVGQILDDAARDAENKDLVGLVSHCGRELLAVFFAIKIRLAVISFVTVLLGELVILINAVMLIKQTKAIDAQTEVLQKQELILERQNELIDRKDKKEHFWVLYHEIDPHVRMDAFRELLRQGKREFKRMSLVRANFQGLAVRGFELFDSVFVYADFSGGATIEDCFFNETDLSESFFNDATITDSRFYKGELARADFTDATLLKVEFEDIESIAGAKFGGAKLNDCSFKNIDLTQATGLSIDQLALCKTLAGSTLPPAIDTTLRESHPHLFKVPEN